MNRESINSPASQNHAAEDTSAITNKVASLRQRLVKRCSQLRLDVVDNSTSRANPSQFVDDVEILTKRVIEDGEMTKAQLRSDTLQNNQRILADGLQALLNVIIQLNHFSTQLYTHSKSLELYRSFRQLYEQFSSCSMIFHGLEPSSQGFALVRQEYIKQQMKLFSTVEELPSDLPTSTEIQEIVEENQKLRHILKQYQDELQKKEARQKALRNVSNLPNEDILEENMRLCEKIEKMQNILETNNDEFAQSVKRYNQLLMEQQQKTLRLEREVKRLSDLDYILGNVREELQLYKEQRFKDQLMIENMSRKIRDSERVSIMTSKDRTLDRIHRRHQSPIIHTGYHV